MSLKQHLKDYSTVYIVAALSAFTGAVVFLASAINAFTNVLTCHSGILTADVGHLVPTVEPVISRSDATGQVHDIAEPVVEIEELATTEYPTQQVDRLKALTRLLEQENPESEVHKLSGQVQEMLSVYQELLEE
jgi:hypothetical protein